MASLSPKSFKPERKIHYVGGDALFNGQQDKSDYDTCNGYSLPVAKHDHGVTESEVNEVRRKLTFPHRRPKLEDLDIPKPIQRPSLRSKSETHVKHLSKKVTVQDLKNEWLEFEQRSGYVGRFSLGVLVSNKPPKNGENSPGKEGLTLLHFDTIGDSPLPLQPVAPDSGTTGRKRQVAFADEVGRPLCEVKVIKQPKEVPEELENAFIWALIYEKIAEDRYAPPSASWDLDFDQPVDDTELFQKTLDEGFIAVENAYLENHLPCRLFGLIKVKNMAYEKVVFVRVSTNRWVSYRDHPASYQADASDATYDAFTFDIEIPKDDHKHNQLQFCACFEIDGSRYWDNNDGENFVVLSRSGQIWWSRIEIDGTENGR